MLKQAELIIEVVFLACGTYSVLPITECNFCRTAKLHNRKVAYSQNFLKKSLAGSSRWYKSSTISPVR